MDTDLHSRTGLLLDRSVDTINRSVSHLYGGEWESSIRHSFSSAQLSLEAVLLSCGVDPGTAGLGRMIRMVERETGSVAPPHLLVNARRLDRAYLQIVRCTPDTLGWNEFPDEEMSVDMLHIARHIVRFCRGRISRLGPRSSREGE